MKSTAFALVRVPLLIVAAMLGVTSIALGQSTGAECPAMPSASTSIPYNPFGVAIPWVKASGSGIDLYAGLTNTLDPATKSRLTQQAQSQGTGTLVLLVVDLSGNTGFPKLVGKKGQGATGAFTWPFSRFDKVVEKNGHRYYRLALTLNPGCWNIDAQLKETTTPSVVLSVP